MGYLQATKKVRLDKKREMPKTENIIVCQVKENIVNTPEGKLIKKTYKGKNITKIMNETKKLVKANTASEKLAEIEKIFTK